MIVPGTIKVTDKTKPDELLKVEKFRTEIRSTKPHKHRQYFEVVYLSKGSGTHMIDYDKFEIKPPVLFMIRQEQVHHWNIKVKPEGYVMIIRKEFVDRCLDPEIKKLLTIISNYSCLQIKNEQPVQMLFALLSEEKQLLVIEGLLKALLAKLVEETERNSVSGRSFDRDNVFQSYCNLLSQQNNLQNSVAYYAQQLNVTPQNLNNICQKAANLSAGDLLNEYMIREARRLLLYTDHTVSEVAYTLNFNDPSHFVKYFKRHTGHTPNTFRKL